MSVSCPVSQCQKTPYCFHWKVALRTWKCNEVPSNLDRGCESRRPDIRSGRCRGSALHRVLRRLQRRHTLLVIWPCPDHPRRVNRQRTGMSFIDLNGLVFAKICNPSNFDISGNFTPEAEENIYLKPSTLSSLKSVPIMILSWTPLNLVEWAHRYPVYLAPVTTAVKSPLPMGRELLMEMPGTSESSNRHPRKPSQIMWVASVVYCPCAVVMYGNW